MKTHWLIGKSHDLSLLDDVATPNQRKIFVNGLMEESGTKSPSGPLIDLRSVRGVSPVARINRPHPSSVHLNPASSDRQQEFDTLIKLNSLGAFTVTSTHSDHRTHLSNRLPPVASVTPLTYKCTGQMSPRCEDVAGNFKKGDVT